MMQQLGQQQQDIDSDYSTIMSELKTKVQVKYNSPYTSGTSLSPHRQSSMLISEDGAGAALAKA